MSDRSRLRRTTVGEEADSAPARLRYDSTRSFVALMPGFAPLRERLVRPRLLRQCTSRPRRERLTIAVHSPADNAQDRKSSVRAVRARSRGQICVPIRYSKKLRITPSLRSAVISDVYGSSATLSRSSDGAEQ